MGKLTVLLDKKQIFSGLGKLNEVFDISLFDSLDSTNSKLLADTAKKIFFLKRVPLYVCEIQTHGRGRRGRKWISAIGDSLTFSFGWPINRPVNALSGLSLVVGLAVLRAFRAIGIYGITLKWPNDIFYGFSKLGGILVEVGKHSFVKSNVVIGIGLNTNFSLHVAGKVDRKIIDLFSITNQEINRNILLCRLLYELVFVLREFEKFGFRHFNLEWNAYHTCTGKILY